MNICWIPTAILGMAFLGVPPIFECKSELKLGSALNVFRRFGQLSTSMRVVHRGDTGWLFREPTIDLFQNFRPLPRLPPLRAGGRAPVFEGDFLIEFCDTVHQLLEAYFRGFTIEMVERSWRAFSATWTKGDCAKNLGMNATFIGDAYSYILVRVSRYRSAERMTPIQIRQLRLEEDIEFEVVPGDTTSLENFFSDFGTHYINSYRIGDALYQVFVYKKPLFKRIKDRLQTEGVRSVLSAELSTYFSPWYADHTGRILSASGNPKAENWAAKQLKLPFFHFSYQSLIQLTDPVLLRTLYGLLGDDAMLHLELRSLAMTFADKRRSKWFIQVLDNQLKLWETEMCKECFTEVNKHNGCPPHWSESEIDKTIISETFGTVYRKRVLTSKNGRSVYNCSVKLR